VADQQLLAQRFEEQRGRLRAVAYRMLGSLSEADDAVQEAWLRLSRADTDDAANLPAWLTTVTGRICLDMLRSRTSRREDSLDVHLPDPVISYDDGADPEGDRLIAVLGFTIAHDEIVAIDVLADPGRLSRIRNKIRTGSGT
jgi:RNA polymerase sigma factor (sigma-70 family)